MRVMGFESRVGFVLDLEDDIPCGDPGLYLVSTMGHD